MLRKALSLSLALLPSSCSSEPHEAAAPTTVTPPPFGAPFEKLSDWHLFADGPGQLPAERVVPYEVNSPLFTDYATKLRFLFVPDGSVIEINHDEVWSLPVGSVLAKTFALRADLRDPSSKLRLLETRVLWHEPAGWTTLNYVWDETGNDAKRSVAGATLPSTFIAADGSTVMNDYIVPNTEACKLCHSTNNTGKGNTPNGVVGPIGPKTRQLDRERDYGGSIGAQNQIDHFNALGLLARAPAPADRLTLVDPFGSSDIALRVRSYWDGNCAHCHTKGSYASSSALLLDFPSTDPTHNPASNFGVCKQPTAAAETCGKTYDVVPGNPDESIMICRVNTTSQKFKMPLESGNLVHKEGAALIRAWIASLPPQSCH